jgi:tRNA threonylcarbamoyladenosine biosynthesis protein TsaB
MLLAIDTSTTQVGVALGDAGGVRAEARVVGERRHAEQLAPAIRFVCDEAAVELSQLSAIAVGIGPGLFTGLRVGVTTAKVMAQALRVPVIAISSLDLVAYPLRHGRRTIVAVLDARRREVFYARYRPVPGGIHRVGTYDVTAPDALAAEIESWRDDVLLAGDGIGRYAATFGALDRAEAAGAEFDAPDVSALVALATARVQQEAFDRPGDVEPMYLRESDAVLAWEQAGHDVRVHS